MTEANGIDFELYFLTEVLKLPSLHYGYWDNGSASDRVGREELVEAQTRFRDELIAKIPEGVQSVLDVGCGIGDSSFDMASRGYDVTAISPCANHATYFPSRNGLRVPFVCTKFEDFETDQGFDLLYFSESVGYIPLDLGVPKMLKLTKPGGHLLVSSTFRSPDTPFPEDFDVRKLPLAQRAQAAGFTILYSEDITENVLPTVEMGHRVMTDFVFPLIEMGQMYMKSKPTLRKTLMGWLLEGPRKKLYERMADIHREATPEYFSTHMRYATLLMQAPQ